MELVSMRARSAIIVCLLPAWFSGAVRAEEAVDRLQPGQPALHYIAAHFASGVWFESPGEIMCPVLGELEKTKLAIFAKEANAQTMQLAVALDQAIQEYPQLRRSFMVVSEERRDASMSDEELAAHLDELRGLAQRHGITKLSLAYLQHSDAITRWRNSLGFFDDADVVVAVIEPGIKTPSGASNQIRPGWVPTRKVVPYYRFAVRLNSADITPESAEATIEKALASLVE